MYLIYYTQGKPMFGTSIEPKKVLKTFTVDPEKHKIFLKLCKINNSDGSKEIRKFMENYIQDHKQLSIQIAMEESHKKH